MSRTISSFAQCSCDASTVQLMIPQSYSISSRCLSSSPFCHVEWSRDEQLLKIVTSDDSRTVLDVMAMEDVIGSNVQIDMKSDNSSLMNQEIRARTKDGGIDEIMSNAPPTSFVADTQATARLTIFCYPRHRKTTTFLQNLFIRSSRPLVPDPSYPNQEMTILKSEIAVRSAAHRTFVLAPVEDLSSVHKLVAAIRYLASHAAMESVNNKNYEDMAPKYLVLVNPKAGQGRAVIETNNVVLPMLDEAGIDTIVAQTEYAQHATDLILMRTSTSTKTSLNSNQWKGDDILAGVTGIVVVSGDGVFHEVVNALKKRNLLKKIKLGMIPCGSGCGIAASTAHFSREDCNVLSCTFLICKGHTVEADTSLYTTRSQSYTSFLTFSWGFVADVDVESECIRCLGTSRFDLWAVLRIIFRRTYQGSLYYKQTPVDSSDIPVIGDSLSGDWNILNGLFVLFWASQVTHASIGVHQSPRTVVGDGLFQIMIIRPSITRMQMIKVLLSIGSGTHVELPGVDFITCSAFRLEPAGSFNVLDGECIESGVVQATVMPKSMKVFGRALSRG